MNNLTLITLNLSALQPLLQPLLIRWKFELSTKTLLICGILLVSLLSIFYIFQINEITRANFLLATYEKQIKEFSKESQILADDFSRVNSLASLENILQGLNYEKVTQIHYLRLPGATVAAKP